MPPILLSYLFSVLVVTALVLLALHNRKTGWRPRRESSLLPALWEAWRKRADEPAAAPWMPPGFEQQLANLSRALGRTESHPAAATSMAYGCPASTAPSSEVQPITRPAAKNNA